MATPGHQPQLKYLPQETISTQESPNLPLLIIKGAQGPPMAPGKS